MMPRSRVRACVRACVCHECTRDSAWSPRHDRLMQSYDVMRLDINIFPLIRQTPSPPPRAVSLNGKTITLDSRARSLGIVEILHLVPSITRSPLHCTEKVTERSGRSRGRQTAKIPSFHERIASHRVASRPVASSSPNRFMPTGQSFRRESHVKTRLQKDTRMRARYLTRRGTNVDNRRAYTRPPARFLRRVAKALARFMGRRETAS